MAASPDGKSIYVTSFVSNSVAVFDRATPSASSPSPPPQPPPPAPDTLAPTVAGFTLAPERFRVARGATPVSAGAALRPRRRPARRGSTVRFSLSEPADTSILVERALPGRKVGRRCQASTRTLRQRRRCTRYQRAGSLTRRNTSAGANAVPFSGRIGRRALAAGDYRATITATDPAGNRSRPKRAAFAIVGR